MEAKIDILRKVMRMAWQFVKRNGLSMSEALKKAWMNIKLKVALKSGIVKFYFQKVNGEIREAYRTLSSNLIPQTSSGGSSPRKDETTQIYFDTERGSWRRYKKANIIRF